MSSAMVEEMRMLLRKQNLFFKISLRDGKMSSVRALKHSLEANSEHEVERHWELVIKNNLEGS